MNNESIFADYYTRFKHFSVTYKMTEPMFLKPSHCTKVRNY